jgi:hypothetical protein
MSSLGPDHEKRIDLLNRSYNGCDCTKNKNFDLATLILVYGSCWIEDLNQQVIKYMERSRVPLPHK